MTRPAGGTAYDGRRILVTGAGGYIAGVLIKALLARGSHVIRLSRRELPPQAGVVDVMGDPRLPATWTDPLLDADIVFHLAAETSTYAAAANPLASLEATVVSTLALIEGYRHAGRMPAVVMASTALVLGLTQNLPASDATPPQPVTVYDMHKLMAEMHLAQAARDGFVRACSLRLANVYGPSPQAHGAADRGILNRMVRKALAGEAVTIYGDGALLRDYVYVDDVAAAFLAAGAAIETCTGRSFLVASGESVTIGRAFTLVAERVTVLTGREVTVRHVDWPAGMAAIEYRNFVGDSRGLADAAGWQPRIALQDGIDRTIAALLEEAS